MKTIPPSNSTADKGSPIPTRFAAVDKNYLDGLAQDTGISVSELIRRSVRLMRNQVRGPQHYGLLLQLHS